MLKKLLSILGFTTAALASSSQAAIAPYQQPEINVIYNLLFCDDPSLFAVRAGQATTTWQATLSDVNASSDKVRALAESPNEESRIRALAFNWLRQHKEPVPRGILLGVVVEVPLEGGLDVLAAYSDGRVRYINQTGKLAVFEGGPPQVQTSAKALVSASKVAISRIGPWDRPRLSPPSKGNIRITFLVSDGLYLGEGPFSSMQSDPMAGPIVQEATQLLQLVVSQATD